MIQQKHTEKELELLLKLAEKYHRELVAKMVREQPELLKKLFEPAPPDTRKNGHGPPKRPYAEARFKHALYLSGANETLLKELVRLSTESAKRKGNPHKQTKSIWINTILEQWLSTNPEIDKLIR